MHHCSANARRRCISPGAQIAVMNPRRASITLSMPGERISATYLVETPLPVARAAEVLAGEQSSGTFVAVPGETDELRQRFGAKVENITELESVDTPSLPGARGQSGKYQ